MTKIQKTEILKPFWSLLSVVCPFTLNWFTQTRHIHGICHVWQLACDTCVLVCDLIRSAVAATCPVFPKSIFLPGDLWRYAEIDFIHAAVWYKWQGEKINICFTFSNYRYWYIILLDMALEFVTWEDASLHLYGHALLSNIIPGIHHNAKLKS